MTIYSGTKKIGSLYFGTQNIAKAYRGDNLVFQKKEPRRLFQNIIVTPMSTSFEIAWDDHIVEAHTVELALWSEQGNLPYHARQQWVSLGGSKDTSPFIVHNIPYRSGYYRIRLRTVNNRSIVENLIVENRACIVGPYARAADLIFSVFSSRYISVVEACECPSNNRADSLSSRLSVSVAKRCRSWFGLHADTPARDAALSIARS